MSLYDDPSKSWTYLRGHGVGGMADVRNGLAECAWQVHSAAWHVHYDDIDDIGHRFSISVQAWLLIFLSLCCTVSAST